MASPLDLSIDFEHILSRDYRPARVTQLVPREKFHPTPVQNSHPPTSRPIFTQQKKYRGTTLDTETSQLVLDLVSQTAEFQRHLPPERRTDEADLDLPRAPPPPRTSGNDFADVEAKFHLIELSDWESNIDWEGYQGDDHEENREDATTENKSNPVLILKRPRNPYLENLVLDTDELLEGTALSSSRPLVLQLGVAGQSVARHVYQNTMLQRPTPATQSSAYQLRLDRDWDQHPITSTAEIAKKGSLHADKDKMEAFIEARQRKRERMAKEKTSRVIMAMGTLAVLGGGRGRTITSSLMGPGGTERTGRPSRHVGSSTMDTEYIEQLDMVQNHSLVKDLSKVLLRQYQRPKLPMHIVRLDLSWQFQIRYVPAIKKADASHTSTLGSVAGAISKIKLRNESDLSPTEGMLVLLEYSEERPPIRMNKGMCSKIVNYYRGDKSHCPVSAGGGERPARRKREATREEGPRATDRPPRLQGPQVATSISDWVGKIVPPKTQKDLHKDAIDILPEGVTELLHPKAHGPFIGEIEENTTQTGLISNLFVAPMFRHEPESTDFLMILTPPSGAARPGQRDTMGVVLRELPSSVYCVGQTEPRVRVNAPQTQGEKNFLGPYVSYQIARALTRSQAREGHGLRFDELQDRVLPNLELPSNAIRQRLKQVAIYDKNTSIWTTKQIGFEDYPGVEALGKAISPEGVAAFETACAAARRLTDLGIHQLYSGSNTVATVGVLMVYLAGQLNATRELHRKMRKLLDLSRVSKAVQSTQLALYEKAAAQLETQLKNIRQKHEVAQFIYEELQLAPWHLTSEFIDVHRKGEGTGMMKLTGLGDPSGQGEGFSFLREADTKPTKAASNDALNAQVKKITGTEDDLRKLTMKQMASLLRSYGMAQKQIDTLKRWDRVHVIRDLSTKAASDGIGDGLERFARGEKMKLSEQKQMYRDRIMVIWRRQRAALSSDGADKPNTDAGEAGDSEQKNLDPQNSQLKKSTYSKTGESESDSDDQDDDDDDLAAALEEEMMDRNEVNQLVAAQAHGGSEGGLGQLRVVTQDQELSKDAQELAALKRQREEERAAQVDLLSTRGADDPQGMAGLMNHRKVIRKRITKIHPDGRQTTIFKFIMNPEEVGKIMARLHQKEETGGKNRNKVINFDQSNHEKPPGHAMFEDEDDFEYSSKGRHSGSRRGGSRRRGAGGRTGGRDRELQFGKLKTRVSQEERMKKRKREEEELEVYATAAKRKTTNNRKNRGSIRERRPHVIFAQKLEAIRSAVEARPYAGPFMKPVNRRLIPRYYEVISNPIDLSTVRNKIHNYEYRQADSLVKDFELMKNNAIKFNTEQSPIAQEAVAMYEFVRDQVESSREEFVSLEEAVQEQLEGGKAKKKKKASSKSPSSYTASVGGMSVNLGDLPNSMHFDGVDSDSGESVDFDGLLDK